jgi:hypothetical protein
MVTATRPLYQPQVPHTVWGTLAAPQRGQSLREGASRRQLLARRIRVFDFDFFFFGTATAVSLLTTIYRQIACRRLIQASGSLGVSSERRSFSS